MKANAEEALAKLALQEAALKAQLSYHEVLMQGASMKYSVDRDTPLRKDGVASLKSRLNTKIDSIKRNLEIVEKRIELAKLSVKSAEKDLQLFSHRGKPGPKKASKSTLP